MRARLLLFVLPPLFVLTLLMPTGHADPRDRFALEDRVPATSLGLISLEDIGSWEARLEKTAVAGFLAEPEVKAFTQPLFEDIKNMLESREAGGPLSNIPPLVKELFKQLQGLKGQLAVAVVDVQPEQELPGIVASLDFGPNTDDFVAFLTRLKEEMGEDGEALATFERDGRVWWQLDTGGPIISATIIDSAFVIATRPRLLEEVVAAKPEGSLGKSAEFGRVRGKLGGDDLGLLVYANVPSIVDLFEDRMGEQTRGIANALGLDTVTSAGYGLSFHGDGFMDTIVIETPGADHGLAMLAALPPGKPKMVRYVPSTAFLYEESSLQTSEMIGRVRTMINAIDADAATEMNEGLAKIGDRLGVDLETELLAGLGDGTAWYLAMPEHGGIYPELCIMLPVKDASGYEATFGKFVGGLAQLVTEQGDVKMSTRKMDFRGQTLHLVELENAQGDDPFPFTPTWTVRDGHLFLTLVPYAMKDVMLRILEGDDPAQGLMGEEDFKQLYDAIPDDTGAFGYLDLQGIVSLLYGTGVPMAQTLVKPNMMNIPFRLDFDQLPTVRTVKKHFRSVGSYMGWTRDGIRLSIRGPVPVVAALAAVGAGAFFAMQGRATSARAMPPRLVRPPVRVPDQDVRTELARVNLEELVRYVRRFAIEKGRLPKSLKELVDSGHVRGLGPDPWKRPYQYEIVDEKSRAFVVRSTGPDGRADTADDIVLRSK